MKALELVKEVDQNQVKQAVLSYKEIQAKMAFLANELKAHKEVIEAAAAQTEDGKIITEEYKIVLSICERENFDKKAALAKLGEKVLKPFMSTSTYTQLRVS